MVRKVLTARSVIFFIMLFGFSTAIADNVITSGTSLVVASGSCLVTPDNVVIQSGGSLQNNGFLLLHKTLLNGNGSPNSLGSGIFVFAGNTVQNITGLNIFQNLTVDNPAGVIINDNTEVNGKLSLTQGLITLGTSHLLLGTSATFAGTPSSSAMIIATGTGELRKSFATGFTGNFTFPVGDATGYADYSPVHLSVISGTFTSGNYLGVRVVNNLYEGMNFPCLGRYWVVSQSGITSPLVNANFQYVVSDILGTESAINCLRVDPPPAITFGPANTTQHWLTANGLTSFGTFTGGPSSSLLVTPKNQNAPYTAGIAYFSVITSGSWTAFSDQPWCTVTPSGNGNGTLTASYAENLTTSMRVVNITVTENGGPPVVVTITQCNVAAGAGTIFGNTVVCAGSTQSYSVNNIPGYTYAWTFPPGWVQTGGDTSNSVTVTAGSTSGTIQVVPTWSCGSVGPASTLFVTVTPLPSPAGAISGATVVTRGQNGVTYSVPAIANATGYVWSYSGTGVTILNGTSNTITVNFASNATSGTLTVLGTNSCGNGTASSLVLTVQNAPGDKHFIPVWTGNGVDQMNINAVEVKLDGLDMETGDEVGIFDGSLCVGAGTVSGTVTIANKLQIVVSANEGTNNGYTPGHQIIFRLFDRSAQMEITVVTATYFNTNPSWITDGKFAVGGTAFVSLNGKTAVAQTISLISGWNIFSVNNLPDNKNLMAVVQPLITAASLVKIQDETGTSLEDYGAFGGWTNNIGDIALTEGYKIKVNQNTQLVVTGMPATLPLNISLKAGWNIIGFPLQTEADGIAVVQQLINRGTLIKVQDEKGSSIEDYGVFGGWTNDIGNFKPGKGYKVKVTVNETLTIFESYPKSSAIIPKALATSHFKRMGEGNGVDHMNINLVDIPEGMLQEGDEIGVFDGDMCVGSKVIGNRYSVIGEKIRNLSIPVTANDGNGIQGFTEGHPFILKIWNSLTNKELEVVPEMVKGSSLFAKHESAFVSLKNLNGKGLPGTLFRDGMDVTIYPNPTGGKVYIQAAGNDLTGTQVRVFNATGQEVLSRFIHANPEVLDLSGHVSGVYTVQLMGGSCSKTEKIILK